MHETQPLRVLIIDDNPVDRIRLVRSLLKGFPESALLEVTNKQELDAALAQSPFDVVVAEYRLKWTDGFKVLKKIRRHFPQTPVIWVSSIPLDELIVTGMKAGLNDYVRNRARGLGSTCLPSMTSSLRTVATCRWRSPPGVGARYIIHLSRVQAPLKGVDLESAPQFVPHGAETILMVEDETVVRDLVRQSSRPWDTWFWRRPMVNRPYS
jgi:CheY-like chemotaxis protein